MEISAGIQEVKEFIKPLPVVKRIKSLGVPAVRKETVKGKHLMELESGDHIWVDDSDLTSLADDKEE